MGNQTGVTSRVNRRPRKEWLALAGSGAIPSRGPAISRTRTPREQSRRAAAHLKSRQRIPSVAVSRLSFFPRTGAVSLRRSYGSQNCADRDMHGGATEAKYVPRMGAHTLSARTISLLKLRPREHEGLPEQLAMSSPMARKARCHASDKFKLLEGEPESRVASSQSICHQTPPAP